MIIIAGHGLIDAAERDAHVDAFRGLVSRARAAEGCLHVAITADSVDPERFEMIEIWRDAESLDAWRRRARAPRAKKARHLDVKRYEATDGGPLF